MDILTLFSLALAPGCAIMIYIYLKDKHEKEPVGLLAISFLFGVLSILLTLGISIPVNMLFLLRPESAVHQFFNAFFKVALIEEFSKFFFVRFILFNNKNFNEPFDGIVYAVMVSMGFATLENLVYVFQSGIVTGIIRMFTAVPAHATFGVLMGYFLGRAKFIHAKQWYYSLVALTAATLFHGAYDYFLFIGEVRGVWTGVWMGAFVSLIAGFVLSRKAIRLHQQASPFIQAPDISDETQLPTPEKPAGSP